MNRQPSVVSYISRWPRSQAAAGLGHDVRRPGHRLDAAADEHVTVADGDRVGRRIDRLQSGATQPIDGQPAHLDREARQQHGHPRDVAIVLAGLVGAAEDDVLDERRIEAGAIDDRPQHGAARSSGRTRRERTAVPPDRGSGRLRRSRPRERASRHLVASIDRIPASRSLGARVRGSAAMISAACASLSAPTKTRASPAIQAVRRELEESPVATYTFLPPIDFWV